MTPDIRASLHVRDRASASIREIARRARQRDGLRATSNPTNQEELMATANPYDRRRDRRNSDHGATDLGWHALHGTGSQPSPLAVEDLEAMVFSARARGEREATDRLTSRHEEELLTARRQAWDEGHEVGHADGCIDLLKRIDEHHGQKVREIYNRGREVLNRVGDDPRKATKRDLELALDAAVDVLAELVYAHHREFVPEPPF